MGDFARAYVAFGIAKAPGKRPQVGKFTKPVIMLRRLVAVMARRGCKDPADVTPQMLDAVVADMVASGAEPYSVEQNAMALRWISEELNRAKLVRSPFQWSYGNRARVKKSRMGQSGDGLMLSQDELDALAEAFNRARTPREQIVTGVMALLCCLPGRISEVFSLPVDCDAVLDPGDGYQAGLRWWPAKGGRSQVKFIPSAMLPVVKKALEYIRRHTEGAREMAREVLAGRASFSDLPPGWPYLPGDSGLTYDRALMVMHPYTIAAVLEPDTTTIQPITYHHIEQALSGLKRPARPGEGADASGEDRTPSIFDTMGITLRDGSSPRINTHKPRHYLNTIANRAAVPQADIALWSGRTSVHQNSTYDHETAEELAAKVSALRNAGKLPAIPIDDRSAFDLAQIKETAHTSEFGWCLQSLRQNPCELYGACLDCAYLVCVKGAQGKLANIRRALETERTLKVRAQARIDAGHPVSPRWIELHDRRITRLEQLVAILESETTVDGSAVILGDMAALPRFDIVGPGKKLASAARAETVTQDDA